MLLAGLDVGLAPELTWEQAARMPLCLLTGKMRNRQILDAAFRRAGVKADVLLETDSLFTLYAHVAEAGFCSIMPQSLMRFFDNNNVQMRPLVPSVTRAIGLIARNRPSVAPVTRAVLDLAHGLNLQDRFESMLPKPAADYR